MEQNLRFSIIDYFNYMNGSENSRKVYEGEEVLNAGHVILCGIIKESPVTVEIYALCLQTSALQSPPHTIEVVFDKSNNQCKVIRAICSCKAGQSARCKHISAVLIFCTRTPLENLERISQTEITCAWSTQKKNAQEKYKAVPVEEMPCFVNKISNDIPVVNEDTLKKIKDNFISALPGSALALHKSGRKSQQDKSQETKELDCDINSVIISNHACQSSLMMELSHFEINFFCKDCEVLYKTKLLDYTDSLIFHTKHCKSKWISERQFRITGSRIYEIYTYGGQDWSKKCNRYFYPKTLNNKYVRHGLEQESVARNIFKNTTGLNVIECGLVVAQFNPWLGFSPDGIIFNVEGNPEYLLEIKCPFSGSKDTLGNVINFLNYVEFKNNIYCLKEKHKYYGQIQLGMSILNLQKAYFIIFCSFDNSMAIIEVNYNYKFAKNMLFNVKEKYFKKMLHEICTCEK